MGSMADSEDSVDVGELKEEDLPLQARVRFHPFPAVKEVVESPQSLGADLPSEGELANSTPSSNALEVPQSSDSLGTRLTMTSRTGYFQDRIISPSMMRAMAILYIGPHRNPDFASDYHLSPILAPAELLAQFPLVLMDCGEKDPFVDDTIIFAGRLREAKRSRLRELEVALNSPNPSIKHGEHLRMSATHRDSDSAMRAMRRERDILAAQTEEDWVQMQIFSEWSHGYLQMPMLMQEARTVIYELADWIVEAFAEAGVNSTTGRPRHMLRRRLSMMSPRLHTPSIHVHVPQDEGYLSSTGITSASETEVETDDALTFVPKRKSPPPTLSSGSSGGNGMATANGSGSSNGDSRRGILITPHVSGRDFAASPRVADVISKIATIGSPSEPTSLLAPKSTTSTMVSYGDTANGTGQHYPALRESAVSTPLDMLSGFVGGSPHMEMMDLTSVPETFSSLSPPANAVGSPGKSHTGGTAVSGKTGQKISESELMRRRRLLDSHLLPSSEKQVPTVHGLGQSKP